MHHIIVALAESDCEDIGTGWLAQPVNALTSLVFSVVGLIVVAWARGVAGIERHVRLGIGIGLIATGIGSFLYHGPQTAGSQFLHDITFLTTLVIVGVANLRAGLHWSERTMWLVVVAVVAVVSIVLVASPAITNGFTGLSIALIVAGDIAVRRNGAIDMRSYWAAIGLLVLALVFFVLGRSGQWLCDPDSLFRGHGLWHVFSGLAVAAYAVATSPARMGPQR